MQGKMHFEFQSAPPQPWSTLSSSIIRQNTPRASNQYSKLAAPPPPPLTPIPQTLGFRRGCVRVAEVSKLLRTRELSVNDFFFVSIRNPSGNLVGLYDAPYWVVNRLTGREMYTSCSTRATSHVLFDDVFVLSSYHERLNSSFVTLIAAVRHQEGASWAWPRHVAYTCLVYCISVWCPPDIHWHTSGKLLSWELQKWKVWKSTFWMLR